MPIVHSAHAYYACVALVLGVVHPHYRYAYIMLVFMSCQAA